MVPGGYHVYEEVWPARIGAGLISQDDRNVSIRGSIRVPLALPVPGRLTALAKPVAPGNDPISGRNFDLATPLLT